MKRALLLGLLATGCVTTFTGNSTVTGGVNGCKNTCASQDMELAGMIVMGDHYTDGCICEVKGHEKSAAVQGAVGASAAVAGVMMQQEEQQRAGATTHPTSPPTSH